MPDVLTDGPPALRDHTTLRLGGPGREWVRATTEADLVAAVSEADAAGTPVLVLAGGSNLVVADAGFDGRVVQVATTGVRTDAGDVDDVSPRCGGIPSRPIFQCVRHGAGGLRYCPAPSARCASAARCGAPAG